MSGSYCHYNSRHATVVTTVVTENHKPMYAIFILMSCAMSGTVFRKNRPSWTTTTATTTMRRSMQRSLVQKSGQPSDDKRAFSSIRRCRRNSWNVSGMRSILSHRRNPSKPHVSWAAGACGEDGSGEMRL